MSKFTLILLLTFTRSIVATSGNAPGTSKNVQDYNNQLAQSYVLNPKNAPFVKVEQKDTPCAAGVVNIWDYHTMSKISSIKIDNQYHIDAQTTNESLDNATLKSISSTATANATTSGWSVTAKGVNAAKSLEVSGMFQQSTTKTITETKTVEYDATCEPKQHCEIQTVTFTAVITGTCGVETWFDAGNGDGQQLCKTATETFRNKCEAVGNKYNQVCTSGPTTKQPDTECSLRVPVQDDTGALLKLTVITSTGA